MIPYSRQTIDLFDISSVNNALKGDFLTTGPKVQEFEQAVCDYTGAEYGVAVSSGTAALHCALFAIGIKSGDEVIVPAITFVATANAVLYCGGVPIFADVDQATLLISLESVKQRITEKTKAIIAVDYAGQPCDYDGLYIICKQHKLKLIADACHSIGAESQGRKVGTLADLTVFSFHPVKAITTGEGGMVVTNSLIYSARMRRFRNHGIITEPGQRVSYQYEMVELGFNYRITDIQAALGISQLKKLNMFLSLRNEIAELYDNELKVIRLHVSAGVYHAYHLYVIKMSNRDELYQDLKAAGINSNVHYLPVYKHPFYERKFGVKDGLCTNAEKVYKEILSLPIWPGLGVSDVQRICEIVNRRG